VSEHITRRLQSRYLVAADDDFRSPKNRRLLDYWRRKAAGRARPAWRDLTLMDVYEIAPDIVVRDVVDGGAEFLCRYCGTAIVEMMGLEPTGRLLRDTYRREAADQMAARYRIALAEDRPIRVVGYVQVVEKPRPLGFEAIVLTLDGDAGSKSHIIMAFDYTYELTLDEAAAL